MSEPVRTRLYPVLALVVAFLIGKGVLSQEDGGFVLELAAVVLAMFGIAAVETARKHVTPVVPVMDDNGGPTGEFAAPSPVVLGPSPTDPPAWEFDASLSDPIADDQPDDGSDD